MKTILTHGSRAALVLAGCVICSSPGVADAQGTDRFLWSITPYIWATTTRLDLAFRNRDIASEEISFGDLFDMMDSAFMIHGEGGRGHWSGFADLTYLSISDTDKRTYATIKSSSEQVFLDAAVAYWPGGPGSKFNVFGGVRYTGLDDEFKLSIGDTLIGKRRSNKDYADALLGLRYSFDLSERWGLLTHADYSFGSSEGTWLLRGLFSYTVGQRRMNRVLLGYQYKQAEFKDGDARLDYTYQGPLAGFSFRF
jgi:hypothetical protein